jgi:site-specific DNA recombinase
MANTSFRKAEAKRAAIYARVSDKSQDAEDKTSISEQISDMEAHCERRGLTIVARYQEVGQGWSKKRSEFQRMLADARQGRFDTIVCWKSDRLSRGMYPAAALMEVVEANQINLEAVMDAIDMKTFGLMAAVGKIELDNFRERSSMGKRGSAKQGRIPIGNVPYGYRVGENNRPEIVEDEAEIVRRIYRMSIQDGMGAPAISRQLNADGIPPAKSGRQWWDGQVHRILSNETYRGTWWYGRARHVSTEEGMQVYEQPEEEWIGVPFPPLIDEETWEKAKALRRQRKTKSKRNTKVFYLLQHMVRCAECGFLMGGAATTKKEVKRNGKVYKYKMDPPRRYYRCYAYQHMRLQCRPKPMIRAERLEGLVWSEVKRVLENPDLIVAGMEALNAQEEDGGGLAEEIASTERDLLNVQLEEDRIIRLYVSGKITEEQMDRQRKFVTERLEMLRLRLDGYRSQQTALAEKRILLENIAEWAEKMGDKLDDLSAEKRKEVLGLLLDGATIDRDYKVQLTLAVPVDEVVSIGTPASTCRNRTRTRRRCTCTPLASSTDSLRRLRSAN